MITKPTYWDIRYSNVPSKDREMVYQRDLMLYEQTTSLQKLAEQQENKTNDVDYTCLRGIDTQTLELLSRLHANGQPHKIIEIHQKPIDKFLSAIKNVIFFITICAISVAPFILLATCF